MANLAEELARLANPAPVFRDPEDIEDDTVAKLSEPGGPLIEGTDEDVSTTSALRSKTAPLLADTDERYAGKKVSRKNVEADNDLAGMFILEGGEDEDSDDEEEEDEASDGEEEEEDDQSEEEEEEESMESGSGVVMSEGSDDVEKDADGDDAEDGDALSAFKQKMSGIHAATKTKQFVFEGDGDYNYSDDDEEDDADDDSEDDEEEDDDDDDEDDAGESEEDDEEEEGEDSDDEHEEAPPAKRRKTKSAEESDEESEGIKQFSKSSVDEEVAKGLATKAQLSLWDSLLKARIEMQKLLTIVNQLPQPDTWSKFLHQGGETFQNKVKEGHSGLKRVLDEYVQLQTALLLQYPDTKNLALPSSQTQATPNKAVSKAEDDDEEITSESEGESESKPESEVSPSILKQKIKLADYPKFLAKRHKDFLPFRYSSPQVRLNSRTCGEDYPYQETPFPKTPISTVKLVAAHHRNNTIQKWYDKTRVATGKISKGFSAFEQSALKQIEQILSDKERLVKRTQLKRTVYRVLGKSEEKKAVEEVDEESRLPSREHLKDYDKEIFDDHDFYHQLLRELIERKTSDISDPVALSRHWLEIQKLRGKVKRKVDTRASKGRKVRYDVHPKLVNFMAPVETSTWSDEAKNDLYSSLFGQRQPTPAAATET